MNERSPAKMKHEKIVGKSSLNDIVQEGQKMCTVYVYLYARFFLSLLQHLDFFYSRSSWVAFSLSSYQIIIFRKIV